MALVALKTHSLNVDTHAGLFPRDVVFLHGNLASNTWWQPALKSFRQAAAQRSETLNGRAICIEWRGCGKSTGAASAPHSSADLEPEQLARDLLEVTELMGLETFDLIGHSLGGLISLIATLRAPERISRLVLLDSVGASGIQFPPEGRAAFLQMQADRAFCAAVMSGTIQSCDPGSAFFQQIVDDTMGVDPLIWTAVPDVLAKVDLLKELPLMRTPTLIIHGELDPVVPKTDSQVLAREIPGAKYIELAGHGHSPNVEDPTLFASMVNEFLFGTNSSASVNKNLAANDPLTTGTTALHHA